MESNEICPPRDGAERPLARDRNHLATRCGATSRTRLGMHGALALLILALAAPQAWAETQYVASNGSDAGACGTADSPCRTISRAIDVAAAGDRIVVLPGVYGDVDGDGDFVSPGDEPASYDTGCHCLVDVDKPVTIVSRNGAGATVLRGAVDGLFAVAISAPGATFGAKRKGFSVVGDPQHDGYGVLVNSGAIGARVEGNVFARLETALFVAGNGSVVRANRISQVFARGIHAEGQGIRILANTVEQAGTLGGRDAGIYAVGFGTGGHAIERNIVVGNMGIGIFVDNGSAEAGMKPHSVAGNLVVGNALSGIQVVLASAGGTAHLTGNSIYGNDPRSNCGLTSLSAGPVLDASGNYWGGPGGPGGDPKDDLCAAGTPPDVSAPAESESMVVAPLMR